MNNLIHIVDKDVAYKTYRNQAVVTFEDVAELHGVNLDTARKSFQRNQKYFVDGEDTWLLEKNDLKDYLEQSGTECPSPSHIVSLRIFSERGYLKLTKPMTDDRSWNIQDILIKSYFRLKSIVKYEYDRIMSITMDSINNNLIEIKTLMQREHDYDSLCKEIKDLKQLILTNPKLAPKQPKAKIERNYLTPTDIGKQFNPPISPRRINLYLAQAEMQFLNHKEWVHAKKALQYTISVPTKLKDRTIYKEYWKPEIIGFLKQYLNDNDLFYNKEA
jgi:hypothetical protein